jgi:nicotinate-nucleotide adenylyltransferase
VLVPTRDAPHKEIDDDPGAIERYELCRLATAGSDWLDVSREELERPGPSYTVDTLRAFGKGSEGRGLCLILGADQAAELPSWHEPEEVLRLASLAIAQRDGIGKDEVEAALSEIDSEANVSYFEMPRIDVSSSDLRERIAGGRPYRYLVPEPVAERIAERGLYREDGA